MDFQKNIINASREIPILAVFSTSSCQPCRMLKPILTNLAREDVVVKIIDADQNHALLTKYQIRSVPTLLLFNIGTVIARINGSMSAVQLNNWIDANIPQPWTEVK